MPTDLPVAWLWLAGLGALHGLNPGMGWLFAVALGLQERNVRGVWRALLPLSLGHALAIVVVIVPAALAGLVLPPATLKWLVAGALLTFALYRIWRRTHPHWGGMQVGMRDLTIWSLLMATAHGAGLMVLPVLLPASSTTSDLHASAAAPPALEAAGRAHDRGMPARKAVMGDHDHHSAPAAQSAGAHAEHLAAGGGATAGRIGALAAALVHTLGYLVMTSLIAVVVYAWAGLRLLRQAWINVDLLWVGVLILTALVTPLL